VLSLRHSLSRPRIDNEINYKRINLIKEIKITPYEYKPEKFISK
jgi:hypothetical protein